jgi:protein-disulfide isomerase
MRDIVLISPWFYPAGTSLLDWLTACSVLSLLVVLASYLFRGVWRKALAWSGATLAVAGTLVSVGMLWVEVGVFESGEPWCVAAWVVLLASFVLLIRQSRSERLMKAQLTAAVILASAAFTYLNFYGLIPTVARMAPDELENLEGQNMLGSRAGTLLITEFADFQCPACAVEDEAMDRLWGTFPGRIQYNFRHLPLRKIHQHAQAAALASQCAAEQGRFWETKRLLFANQERLGSILAQPVLPTIPAEAAEKYTHCVSSKSAWSEVETDIARAKRLGLHGTPTIVIGDKLIRGMLTYPRLALIVRHELKSRNLLEPQQASARPEAGCASAPVTTGCAVQ